MTWQILSSQAAPPFPSEAWDIVPLNDVPNVLLYGFRITVPPGLPANWNTLGYWGFGQQLDGRLILGETFAIPNMRLDGDQALIGLWPPLCNYQVTNPLGIHIAFSIHKWILRDNFELYGRF